MTAIDEAERRRGRWLVLGLVLVLVLFVTGTALAQRYEPLARGSYGGAGDATAATRDGADVLALPFRAGGTAAVLVTVRNSGRFAVTVDGIVAESGLGLRLESATGIGSSERTPLEGTVRLPHRLGPGEELGLRLVYRLPRCGAVSGARTTLGSFPVRWHAFRSQHVTFLPMTPVELVIPADAPPAVTRPC